MARIKDKQALEENKLVRPVHSGTLEKMLFVH